MAAEATYQEVEGRRLRPSNLGKVHDPGTGFRKTEVLHYYAPIAPTLLPISGAGRLWSDRKSEDIHLCRLADTASLLSSVNHGNLEMHPPLSVAPDFDTPTTLVFDLDPGDGAGILDAAEIALAVHDMLRGGGLERVARTTGSKGVQAHVPLNGEVTSAATTAFARNVAEVMAARMGDRVVAWLDKRPRTGKVFVDWGQNDRHKSTVAPYSPRAKPARPTVSPPVDRAELAATTDADALLPSPQDALDRAAGEADRFALVLSLRQRLP